MNVWAKAALFVVGGLELGKLTNDSLFYLLNTSNGGVDLSGAFVPALFGTVVQIYMFYLAVMVIKNKPKDKKENNQAFQNDSFYKKD